MEVLPPKGPVGDTQSGNLFPQPYLRENACQLTIDIYTSSNWEEYPRIIPIEQGESVIELATTNQMGEGSGYLRGTIGCQGEEELAN